MESSECDKGKPGDGTDELLFPWLTTERIFTEDEVPPLETYLKFYTKVMGINMGRAFAIISMNSEVCVMACTMITDLKYIPDLNQFTRELTECLTVSEQDTPIIAIDLIIVWMENVKEISVYDTRVSKTTYSNTFPTFKTVIYGDMAMHANIIIVDRIEKIVERFEPNPIVSGSDESIAKRSRTIDSMIRRSIVPILGDGFRYCTPQSYCPRGGPQDDEYCAAWSFFYLHLRLTNPNLSRGEISRRLNVLAREGTIIADYLEVMRNTYVALHSPDKKQYSHSQRARYEEMVQIFSRRHFGAVLLGVIDDVDRLLDFLRRIGFSTRTTRKSTAERLYWYKVLHGRAVWAGDDGRLRYIVDGKVKL